VALFQLSLLMRVDRPDVVAIPAIPGDGNRATSDAGGQPDLSGSLTRDTLCGNDIPHSLFSPPSAEAHLRRASPRLRGVAIACVPTDQREGSRHQHVAYTFNLRARHRDRSSMMLERSRYKVMCAGVAHPRAVHPVEAASKG
jgi:hypothetical protein